MKGPLRKQDTIPIEEKVQASNMLYTTEAQKDLEHFVKPKVNRTARTHDKNVTQNKEMTQDLFCDHLSKNKAVTDALSIYNEGWTKGTEKVAQRNVYTNRTSKDKRNFIYTTRWGKVHYTMTVTTSKARPLYL